MGNYFYAALGENKEDNSMKFTKRFIIFGLCILVGGCDMRIHIDIGDYEAQLAAWNSQNMLDYQISGTLMSSRKQSVFISVRNGIPESSNPPEYITSRAELTITEFYSLIKELEKQFKDWHNSGDNRSLSLKVSYNTEYHYPDMIINRINGKKNGDWQIALMPLEEGELEINIGDYEAQLAAWNSQNMLDYWIEGWYCTGDFNHNTPYLIVEYNVINGIPEQGSYVFTNMRTIPEIYSFIKEEEERIGNVYNGVNRSYLNVQYDTEYHYPVQINSG